MRQFFSSTDLFCFLAWQAGGRHGRTRRGRGLPFFRIHCTQRSACLINSLRPSLRFLRSGLMPDKAGGRRSRTRQGRGWSPFLIFKLSCAAIFFRPLICFAFSPGKAGGRHGRTRRGRGLPFFRIHSFLHSTICLFDKCFISHFVCDSFILNSYLTPDKAGGRRGRARQGRGLSLLTIPPQRIEDVSFLPDYLALLLLAWRRRGAARPHPSGLLSSGSITT